MLTNRPVITTKQTEKSPIFCPSYEDFDEIFGARNTVNLPYAKEVGVVASSQHVNMLHRVRQHTAQMTF